MVVCGAVGTKMGNCVFVHKSTDPKEVQFGVQVEAPGAKERGSQVAEPGPDQEGASLESSREVMFFDSQAWLDSDAEDYFSIDGEFTPSRGNTPIHPKSSLHNGTLSGDSEPNAAMPKPPQTEMNKQLFELFCESIRYDTKRSSEHEDSSKGINFPDATTTRSPYTVCSSEATPNGGAGFQPKKDKPSQSAECCFPGFVRSLSFRERKRRPSAVESGAW